VLPFFSFLVPVLVQSHGLHGRRDGFGKFAINLSKQLSVRDGGSLPEDRSAKAHVPENRYTELFAR
jgi:hypothetical protein